MHARPPKRLSWLIDIAVFAGIGFLARAVSAQTPTVLANFSYYGTGANPLSGLIAGPDGNLYGVTNSALFEYNLSTNALGSMSLSPVGLSGPTGPLALDPYGNIVGEALVSNLPAGAYFSYSVAQKQFTPVVANTTAYSGLSTGPGGVIYSIDDGNAPFPNTPGIYTITGLNHQVNFLAPIQNQYLLPSSVTVNTSGNIYGTTQIGGSANKGTIFRIDAVTHQETMLYSFDGSDGLNPMSGLAIDPAGNLYGTTHEGGPQAGVSNGTAFEWSASTGTLTTLARIIHVVEF